MPIEFSHTDQSQALHNQFKRKLYEKCYNNRDEDYMVFSGLPVGIISGLATIVNKVSTIAECVFKGLANTFGSLFSKNLHFTTGLKQLGYAVKHVVTLPLSIGWGILEVFMSTLGAFADPDSYYDLRYSNYKPKEAQENVYALSPEEIERAHETVRRNKEIQQVINNRGNQFLSERLAELNATLTQCRHNFDNIQAEAERIRGSKFHNSLLQKRYAEEQKVADPEYKEEKKQVIADNVFQIDAAIKQFNGALDLYKIMSPLNGCEERLDQVHAAVAQLQALMRQFQALAE